MASRTDRPVVASGGISSLADLEDLRASVGVQSPRYFAAVYSIVLLTLGCTEGPAPNWVASTLLWLIS